MKFRKAKIEEIATIVQLLANDPLGKEREDFSDPLPQVYRSAFEKIDLDPNQNLIVLENESEEIVGTFQLSFLQYLTYQGGIRAQIEAVRIRQEYRGLGLGEKLIQYAIELAKEKGAHVVQLTTDKKRPAAINFYEKLGFHPTHEGMKLHLSK